MSAYASGDGHGSDSVPAPPRGALAAEDVVVDTDLDQEPDPDAELNEEDDDEEEEDESFQRLSRRLENLGFLPSAYQLDGPAERGMLRTLSTRDLPLVDREAFAHAHRGLARAVEAVIDSTYRPARLTHRLRVLNTIAAPFVQMFVGWILRSQTNRVFTHVRRLYELREANAVWRSADHYELRRCRVQIQMICSDLGSGGIGLPLFLLSGAFISAAVSVIRSVVHPALHSHLLTVVLVLVVVALFLVLAVAVLQAASIARMRLRLAFGVPLTELYRAIGSTGRPPRDNCFVIAIVGIALFALAAVAVPSGLFLFFRI